MFFLHNGNWDSEEGNCLLFRSPYQSYKYGLRNLENLCLNLWSAKWLKPSSNLWAVLKLKVFIRRNPFGSGLINLSIRILNIWHENKLRMLIPRLFHLVIAAGEKGFFDFKVSNPSSWFQSFQPYFLKKLLRRYPSYCPCYSYCSIILDRFKP